MSFITMNYFSQNMGRSVRVNVILPFDMNFAQVTEPYKTLYFLPVTYKEDEGIHDIILCNKMLDAGVGFLLKGKE